MSAEFDEIRRQAVRIAEREMQRPLSELIETGMENRGTAIDQYLNNAGVSQRTIDNTTTRGADNRMWCGMYIYYCYTQAARGRRLPFDRSVLWGGRGLLNWARLNRTMIVDPNSEIQAGDIFATRGYHIGMATGVSDGSHTFPTIEGNQGDLAHPRRRGIARSRMNVKGCCVIVRI